MKLKQISRILVQFSPWTGEARSAREFLARVTSAPAHASNPDCKVEHRIMYVPLCCICAHVTPGSNVTFIWLAAPQGEERSFH